MTTPEARKASQQRATQVWHLRAGRELDNRYALLDRDGVTWTALLDLATPFDTKAEAGIVQSEIVGEIGIGVAIVPRVGPGPDRPRHHER